jgi:hypothetical protein
VKLVLTIQVLAGMDPQRFVVPLDLVGPATLKITPGQFGYGNRISVLGEDGEPREWFAHRLLELGFEG